MSRPVLELDGIDGLTDAPPVIGPVRFIFSNPRRGGPALGILRRTLAPKGRMRISATPARVFVDVDPGPAESPTIALDTIVRSDATGLERMILSVLPYVDEIVLAVDGRSDDETLDVARAYADVTLTFDKRDIGMSEADWMANKIDFAAARNVGRKIVQAPWALVLDSDEYLWSATDKLRELMRAAPPEIGGFGPIVRIEGFEHRDAQRLTRTRYRWTSSTHNQLQYTEASAEVDAVIVQDLSLRSEAERKRRNAQRNDGIEDLVEEADKGNVTALFHLAKHRASIGDINEAVRLTEDYRLRIEPHGPMADERVWAALALAFRFYGEDNLVEADRWGVRALLDGPCVTAFCLLGDIAEDDGDLPRAQGWYEAACAVTEKRRIEWPGVTELRVGRLAGIKRALANGSADTLTVEDAQDA